MDTNPRNYVWKKLSLKGTILQPLSFHTVYLRNSEAFSRLGWLCWCWQYYFLTNTIFPSEDQMPYSHVCPAEMTVGHSLTPVVWWISGYVFINQKKKWIICILQQHHRHIYASKTPTSSVKLLMEGLFGGGASKNGTKDGRKPFVS